MSLPEAAKKKKKSLVTLFGRLRQGESKAEFPLELGLLPTGLVSLEPVELTFCTDPGHTHFTGSGLTGYPSVLPYAPTIDQTVARPIPLVHRRRTVYQVDHLDDPQLAAAESLLEGRAKRSLPDLEGAPGGRTTRTRREEPPVGDGSVLLQAGWSSYRVPLRVEDADHPSLTLGVLVTKLGAQFAAASSGCGNLFGSQGLGALTFVASDARTEGTIQLEVAPRTRVRVRDPSLLKALGFTQPGLITVLQRQGPAEGQKTASYYVENLSWTDRRVVVAEKPVKSGTLLRQALRPFQAASGGDPDPRMELDLELLSASAEIVVDYSSLPLPKGRASVTQQLVDGLLQLTADLVGLDPDGLYFSRNWPKASPGVPGRFKIQFPKIPYGEKLKNVLTVRLTFGAGLAKQLGIGDAGYFELNGRTATQLTLEGLSEAGQHDPQLAVVLSEWPRGGTPKGSLASPNHERMKALKDQFAARKDALLAMLQIPPGQEEFDTASEGDQSLEEAVAKGPENQAALDDFARALAAEFARREQLQQQQQQQQQQGEPEDQQPAAAAEPNPPQPGDGEEEEEAAAPAIQEPAADLGDPGEQLLLETQRDPFETVTVANPELQPPSQFTVLRTDYPGKCSKPTDFPSNYSLLLEEGEPLDYIAERGFVSLLGLMSGTRPSYANGSFLKNLQHSRVLHLEILDQSQHPYKIPVSRPFSEDSDGFLRLTVTCQSLGH